MNGVKVFFSDYFEVPRTTIEEYGAVDISLINDMPLFIDPFLLFNSEKEAYQKMHKAIIDYLLFLKEKSESYPEMSQGMRDLWFKFPEVKQNWLGFSLSGNSGTNTLKEFTWPVNVSDDAYGAKMVLGNTEISEGSRIGVVTNPGD